MSGGSLSSSANSVPITRTVNSKALSSDIVLDNIDIGLGSVTNDAQLKRSSDDFTTFTEKTSPSSTDIILLEDSADSNNKKKMQLGNAATLFGGTPSSFVSSFNSRSGTVTPQSGDYSASSITNTPAGNIAATNVQSALNELDSEKQAALGYTPENSANKGVSNGYAPLGSDIKISTAYLPDAILGALNYQGTWNANTNSPSIPTAASDNKGYYYVVSTAGTTTISGINDWEIGDWIVSNGSSWNKIDNSDKVSSINSRTGAVTLTSADVSLGNVTNDAQLKRAANDFSTFTEKTIPVSTDILVIEDSANSGTKKYVQLGNISGMMGSSPTSSSISKYTLSSPPQSIANNEEVGVAYDQISNASVIPMVMYQVAGTADVTNLNIDFDLADEALYNQEDATNGTDFSGGVVTLHNSDTVTKLLIHADGASITDDVGHTITANNGVSTSATQSKFGGKSIFFDNTNDYLEIASNADFALGSGDFTIEFWLYTTGNSNERDILFRIGTDFDVELSITIGHATATDWSSGGQKIGLHLNYDGSTWGYQGTSTTSIGDSNWHHIRLVRQGTAHKLYIDGALDISTTYTFTYLQEKVNIGGQSYGGGTRVFSGYIDEIRLMKGFAANTSGFTPPSSAFTYTPYPVGGYYVTIGSTLQIPVYDKVFDIDSLTLTTTEPTNTSVKWLVSWDAGTTWQYYSGGAWHNSSLANIGTDGMSTSSTQTLFTNLAVPSGSTKLSLACQLSTTDATATPSVSGVSIVYDENASYAPAVLGSYSSSKAEFGVATYSRYASFKNLTGSTQTIIPYIYTI